MYEKLFADLTVLAFKCGRHFTDKWVELTGKGYYSDAWDYDRASEDLAWLFCGNDIDYDTNYFEQNYQLLFCEIKKLRDEAMFNYVNDDLDSTDEVLFDIFNSLNDVLCVISEKQKKLEEKYYGRI